jgi:NadR type nicotinamide-nucleotide adenylyltransferase
MVQPSRISIIGAVSTGKTELARGLAAHYRTCWVPEFARTFLLARGGSCQFEDMITIGESQAAEEDRLLPRANRVLFSDGSPLASCVWSQRYFGGVMPDLLELSRTHAYDLYLLTDVDLPWTGDGLRNSEHLRMWLNEESKSALERFRCRYAIVRGIGVARLTSPIEVVDKVLNREAS